MSYHHSDIPDCMALRLARGFTGLVKAHGIKQYHTSKILIDNFHIMNLHQKVYSEYIIALLYRINLPGSTCRMVLTLSRNVLTLFSSPFAALTLNTFVASPAFDPAIIPGGGIPSPLLSTIEARSPVNRS